MSAVENAAAKPKFVVKGAEKIDPPHGCEGKSWYRYVIESGRSTIVGCRSGTLQQVTEHAKEYAAELNFRAANGGHSAWSPRNKKRKS